MVRCPGEAVWLFVGRLVICLMLVDMDKFIELTRQMRQADLNGEK